MVFCLVYTHLLLYRVQVGPGSSDIDGDAGEGTFLRGIINLQDLSADGMKNRWGDDGLDQLTTTSDWDENNKIFGYLFNRMYYSIAQANNLIGVLNSVSIENSNQLIAEAQFIRALSYYYLIDVFGKGVLATEDNLGESNPLPEASTIRAFQLCSITNARGRTEFATDKFLWSGDKRGRTNASYQAIPKCRCIYWNFHV